MLGIDFAVWLALILSLASTALCVVYGLSRWNADDDSSLEPLPPAPVGLGGPERETERPPQP